MEKEKEQQQAEKQAQKKVDPATLAVPEILSLLPLHGFVFFPGMGFPLQVADESSKQLIDDALLGDRMIGLVSTRKKAPEDMGHITEDDLYRVGVIGYIHKLSKEKEGYYHVVVSGTKKIEIVKVVETTPFHRATVLEVPMVWNESQQGQAMIHSLRTQFAQLVQLMEMPKELGLTLNSLDNPFHISYLVTTQLNLKVEEEQEILEIRDFEVLLKRVMLELSKRLETLETSQKLQESVKKDIEGRQREFFLRQQMESIRKELGEDGEKVEVKELKEKFEAKKLPEEVRTVVDKELIRLERISPASPEYSGTRNYLDWILDLPWHNSTDDNMEISEVRQVLDEDHYGLEKVKKRIVEYLAVRKLKKDKKGPILCLLGPPGVGKTSLGKSIARALGRKFVRVSLGGVHDEAAIRGHRRIVARDDFLVRHIEHLLHHVELAPHAVDKRHNQVQPGL